MWKENEKEMQRKGAFSKARTTCQRPLKSSNTPRCECQMSLLFRPPNDSEEKYVSGFQRKSNKTLPEAQRTQDIESKT